MMNFLVLTYKLFFLTPQLLLLVQHTQSRKSSNENVSHKPPTRKTERHSRRIVCHEEQNSLLVLCGDGKIEILHSSAMKQVLKFTTKYPITSPLNHLGRQIAGVILEALQGKRSDTELTIMGVFRSITTAFALQNNIFRAHAFHR